KYWAGKTHDYTILKEELSPLLNWFKNLDVYLDLGYLGFAKDYCCKSIFMPSKSKKSSPLTEDQRHFNRQLSSQRVGIEHSIGGMKRYRIISDRIRAHNLDNHDSALEACAGLWNFYLSN
ncbi:transposase family protein, partial [Arundinibacter roseus]